MIENIQKLYKQIRPKGKFFEALSEHTGLERSSLKMNWFSSLWAVPKNKQESIVKFMQEYIFNENQKKNKQHEKHS
tara:strand:+ start:62 stop:289 length:228 start_codon:yes stop_codon:yes gene_type:complete